MTWASILVFLSVPAYTTIGYQIIGISTSHCTNSWGHIYFNRTLAVTRFNTHQSTICHKAAVLKTITLPKTTQDIGECPSRQHRHENCECRQSLLSNKIIYFLVWQCLLLHGDGDESESNYVQLLKLQGEDDSRIHNWLRWKTDKYTSPEMQSKMIQVWLLRFFESWHGYDGWNHWRVKLWTSRGLSSMGQWRLRKTKNLWAYIRSRLKSCYLRLKTFLWDFNPALSNIRGQCYDAAAGMAEYKTGVATRLL